MSKFIYEKETIDLDENVSWLKVDKDIKDYFTVNFKNGEEISKLKALSTMFSKLNEYSIVLYLETNDVTPTQDEINKQFNERFEIFKYVYGQLTVDEKIFFKEALIKAINKFFCDESNFLAEELVFLDNKKTHPSTVKESIKNDITLSKYVNIIGEVMKKQPEEYLFNEKRNDVFKEIFNLDDLLVKDFDFLKPFNHKKIEGFNFSEEILFRTFKNRYLIKTCKLESESAKNLLDVSDDYIKKSFDMVIEAIKEDKFIFLGDYKKIIGYQVKELNEDEVNNLKKVIEDSLCKSLEKNEHNINIEVISQMVACLFINNKYPEIKEVFTELKNNVLVKNSTNNEVELRLMNLLNLGVMFSKCRELELKNNLEENISKILPSWIDGEFYSSNKSLISKKLCEIKKKHLENNENDNYNRLLNDKNYNSTLNRYLTLAVFSSNSEKAFRNFQDILKECKVSIDVLNSPINTGKYDLEISNSELREYPAVVFKGEDYKKMEHVLESMIFSAKFKNEYFESFLNGNQNEFVADFIEEKLMKKAMMEDSVSRSVTKGKIRKF